ncbi:hypothetical protein, unlikely [Trypanosoma congolense IL3000]|uniref:Uncharacterized protein n=1 Tax=Trypanosoma congolense (strain IL3000) TaxID=1068625 RepID=F9WEE5_TRYCI|nr:hypothetical protein, unlikely [Trypanosoma congolense IL3000]
MNAVLNGEFMVRHTLFIIPVGWHPFFGKRGLLVFITGVNITATFPPAITLGATLPHCAVMIETPARNVFSQSRHLPQSPNITMKSSGNSWCVWGTRMESDRHCLNSVRAFGTQCPSTYACYLPE